MSLFSSTSARHVRHVLVRFLSQPPAAAKLPYSKPSLHQYHQHHIPSPRAHRQSSRWRPPSPSSSSSHQQQANILSSHPSYTTPTNEHQRQQQDSSTRQRLLISYHDLEHALERRGLRSVRAVLTAALILSGAIGLAWPRIKQWGAEEGAEVAAASLEHEQLQTKFSSMVHDVLNDPETVSTVETLLKNAVTELFKDEEFTDFATEWTAYVMQQALMTDAVIDKGTEYVSDVFAKDDSVVSAKEFLTDAVTRLVADEVVQDTVSSNFWSGIRASMIGRRRPSPSNKTDAVITDVSKNKDDISNNKTTTVSAASSTATSSAIIDSALSDSETEISPNQTIDISTPKPK